ncbi:hypothetical protein MB02_05860 [Croceicoccus estronivorus]|uniref:GNAT family N-acetyltransferase n=1 Tax=Croceicoccus estronivorus TaxID=1172626 RepID=UPI00083595B9|nr:GNAT family N-acetyltransferase [Croceicoccus estronivorus]OCC24965.1 hypothetical protein MB02_05860 [Croceicoccus estronivorus]
MFIRSERLFLRPAFPEDWQEIHSGICDESVTRMLTGVPWPYGENDAREYASRPQNTLFPHCLITLPETLGAPVIGCIGLDKRTAGIELGYWIARKHWGRGYATEAGQALMAAARALGHRRIHAGHAMDNNASARVLEKLGFRPTGEVRARSCAARRSTVAVRCHVLELGEATGNNPEPRMPAAA